MNEFVILKVKTSGYDRFLLCLTFESIATYKSLVELSPLIMFQTGKILIDQLLVTGNGQNRFISCEYVNGILDFTTAQSVRADDCFQSITVKWLNAHYTYVENSILTEKQRLCIQKCVLF